MVVVVVEPLLGWVGGTGSVPVGMSVDWANAPQVVASMMVRARVLVSFFIGYSVVALVALRGD